MKIKILVAQKHVRVMTKQMDWKGIKLRRGNIN
jgi:hypothetical protein